MRVTKCSQVDDLDERNNVWGEPVFNVMVAGWFCEKSS